MQIRAYGKDFFEKMEHVVHRHGSSGAGRGHARMREWGTHGMPAFGKGSCKRNALAGAHWALGAGQGKGGQRREHLFIHPTNICHVPAMHQVLFLPLGIQ